MAKRSGTRETNVELSCMWGLFSIIQSCRCLESPKFISHGWPVNRHEIAHHPRKLPTSFDGECRKIRDEVESRRVSSFNGSVGSALNFLQDDFSIVDNEQQHGDTGSARVLDLAKARQALNQISSVSGLDNAADLPLTSAEESSNELERSMQQVQMSAKEANSEPKSFSRSLELLSLSKGRFIDLLPEPDSLLSRRFKSSRTGKERIKSMLDAKLSEYMCREATSSQKAGNLSAVRKGKTSKHSRKMIDYQLSCSPKMSSVCQPNDKIVILKPEPQNVKNFEYLICNPLRERRKKLNRAFGSTTKESNQCSNSSTSLNMNGKVGKKKQDLKSNRDSDAAGLSKNREFDVVSEAKRHLSERLRRRNDAVDVRNVEEQPLKTLQRILASPEHDFVLLSPRRSSEIPVAKENTCPSSVAHETATLPTDIAASNDQSETMGSESHKNDECSMLYSLSENEASTSPADDLHSTRSSVCQSDVADSLKSQEHESPVSVLEPCFIDDADSPQNTTLQTARRELQPRHLDFEVRVIEPFPSNTGSCTAEQDPLFNYVRLIMQASRLDWDQLVTTRSIPEELLPTALFDEMELQLPPTECSFDFKLLLDHINEVLIEIHRSRFSSRSPLLPGKPKLTSLTELVLHEITQQADFYLLPHTDRRTLDQLVAGNIECCSSWLDLQPDSEQITAEIADDCLEECILQILYESLP